MWYEFLVVVVVLLFLLLLFCEVVSWAAGGNSNGNGPRGRLRLYGVYR